MRHDLLDGAVHLYRRPDSPYWQCAGSVAGKYRRTTTHEKRLARAKEVAHDWYCAQLDKFGVDLKRGTTFAQAAGRFIDEFELVTQGERSPVYVNNHRSRLRNHLNPFFGRYRLGAITSGLVHDYRIHRIKTGAAGGPPARSTLHQEIVCLRQVLKFALRQGWLDHLPDLSAPYRASGKVAHRAWFSPAEYALLCDVLEELIRSSQPERRRARCEDLYDYVVFMANTGLRPDEALRTEYRDVTVVDDRLAGQRILEIAVRGKRGVGWCKSTPQAVAPFLRLKARADGRLADRLFPSFPRKLFNAILEEHGLKLDREGQRRSAYSLRHTYISARLAAGADIYQLAKNCRTSVAMIETHYAVHIKDVIDASAINVDRLVPV